MEAQNLSVPVELLDQIPGFVAVIDPGGVIHYWNRGAEELTGIPRVEALGLDPLSVSSARPAGLVREGLETVLAGRPWEGEIPTVGRLGVVRPVRYRAAPIFGADGSVEGAIITGVDLTEHRESEAARRRSERDYRAAIDTALDGFVMTTREGRIIDANQAFCHMVGRTLDELDAMTLFELEVEAGSDPRAKPRLSIENGRARVDARYRHKDGHPVEVEIAVSHADPAEGRFFVFVRDVTERRRLEEQLRQAQKMEAVGRLAGGVAHDFNNLLTAIGGYSELLLNSMRPGDPRRGDVEEIRRAGERAAALTRQLLAFSRKQVLRPKVLDLNATVADVEKMLRRLIGEDVAMTTELAPDLPRVKADPSQIEQVLMNLAVNARDAMPEGGTLRIATSQVVVPASADPGAELEPGPYVVLEVADTGVGIDEGVRAHLFEPFFTTKEKGKGTGLGLATVYGIVSQSGGHIQVVSTPGRGTRFRVHFPPA